MKNFLFALSVLCIAFTSCQPADTKQPATEPAQANDKTPCDSVDYSKRTKVAVIIYDGVEVVDMNGPIDVFTKANYEVPGYYYVYTVAAKAGTVYTEACNTAITPRYTFNNCPSPDIVVLPGVADAQKILADPSFNNDILPWLKQMGADTNKIIMSVCTGGILLGKTGLLDGKKATTHYLALDLMKQLYPSIDTVGGVRFVDDGKIITTAGITSGIDGALHLVERINGKDVAKSAAEVMVYNRYCPMNEPSN
jgi:transcriptional regulator GlxA family with amidase domain